MIDLTLRKTEPVTITVWGKYACWTRPEQKVERLSSAIPTPSGIRGLLSAIYSKPVEFYWQVLKIEVLNPIQFTSFQRNEVKNKLHLNKKDPESSYINIEDCRTQRQSTVLKDVKYRITAEMVLRPGFSRDPFQVRKQFVRRCEKGQNYYQPCMGLREFAAYYKYGADENEKPISQSTNYGLMLYDVFNLHNYTISKKPNPSISLYEANMVNGVIEIPPYDSDLVLKPGKEYIA